MPYNGLRFRVEGRLAGKRYGEPFGLDVAFADAILGEPDELAAEDVLDFIGVPPPVLRVCPIETHIAEKVHAYTLPRQRANSRVKDLPDYSRTSSSRSEGVVGTGSSVRPFHTYQTSPWRGILMRSGQ